MDIDFKLKFNTELYNRMVITELYHAEYSNKGSLIGPISFWCANIEEKWFDYYETEPPNDVVFLMPFTYLVFLVLSGTTFRPMICTN